MTSHLRRRCRGSALAVLLALTLSAPPALAAGQGSERRNCDRLGSQGFERIGERAMGRMLGSPRAHQSMDELMAQMMGGANEQRMHEAIGERFAGCGNPPLPGGYAGMMGTMGMMGGFGPGPDGRGTFSPDGPYNGPGSMMGFASRDGGGRNHNDVPVGWTIAMILVLVGGAGATAYAISRLGQGRRDPRRLLAQRFARGEIGADEYRRRHDLLGGAR